MTTRTATIRVVQPWTAHVERLSDCTVADYSFNNSAVSLTSSFTGVSFPAYKRNMAAGTSATTPANWQKERAVACSGSAYCSRNSSFCSGQPTSFTSISGAWIPIPSHQVVVLSDTALNTAKRKCLNDVREILNPVMGGEILGDIRETLHMIRRPASSLLTSVRNYHVAAKRLRHNIRIPRRRREQVIANLYLEYTFGWNPLIEDSRRAIDVLIERLERRPFEIKRVNGYGRDSGSAISRSGSAFGHVSVAYDVVTKYDISYRVFAGVKVRAGSVPGRLAEQVGFSLDEFVPTLWELLPYSFLIDYFTNIGQIIDAVSLCNSNLAWLGYNKKSLQETSVSSINILKPWSDVQQVSCSLLGPRSQRLLGFRDVLSDLVPSLEFRLPGFGTKTALNIGFLLLARQTDRNWSER